MKKNFMIIYIYSILYKLKLALIILLNSKSRNIIKKNLTEEQVLIKISNFCKKNKLKLVVKYRKKFPIIKIEKYSRYNYPGVVTNYKVNDFINTFENLDLSNFKIDEENLIKYKETYLGINKNNFQLNYFYNILQNRLKN